MFLLGARVDGQPRRPAFVAGLAYAFAPYRIASIPHLQVLSSAWMPFVISGLRRHFDTGSALRPLAGAAAAWIAQNLSCGYYLLFFSPVVLALHRLGAVGAPAVARRAAWSCDRRRVRGRRSWRRCRFSLPYLELRRLGFSPRSLAETRKFSADVYAYLTADPNLRLWGRAIQAWPRAEGLLFPGAAIVALAAVGAWRLPR